MQTAPYGTWTSPITAADLVSSGHPAGNGRFACGDQLWWTELRPSEGGRQSVRRLGEDGQPEDVIAAPWNARTRVHEYGGASWLPLADGTLVFCEFSDQRLDRLDPGAAEPVPITPAVAAPESLRYADPQLSPDGTTIWCIRESHSAHGTIVRDLCSVPLAGDAAEDPAAVRSIVGGSTFLANARLSPDGQRLAWIAWNHPQMPWDGTELRLAERAADGSFGPARTVAGSTTESIMQPEWLDNQSLYLISDRIGWWNLYEVKVDGNAAVVGEGQRPELRALCPYQADFAGPMWLLGARWYAILDDGRLLTVRTFGSSTLAILDPKSGQLADVELADLATMTLGGVAGNKVLLTCSGSRSQGGIRLIDLGEATISDVRMNMDTLPDPDYLPQAQLMTFAGPGGRAVHCVVYQPRNPDFQAPEGELPPLIAYVHGGPTAHVSPTLELSISYLSSRGIGVIEVNYGGSSGYGRE
ncbi:MAG: S9 family peptidase, partial [Jatrophihabitantaceae bacterium]